MKKFCSLLLLLILIASFCSCSSVNSRTDLDSTYSGHGDVTVILRNENLYTYSNVEFEFVNETMVKISGVFSANIKNEDGSYTTPGNTENISHTFFVPVSRIYSISFNDYDKTKYNVNTP